MNPHIFHKFSKILIFEKHVIKAHSLLNLQNIFLLESKDKLKIN